MAGEKKERKFYMKKRVLLSVFAAMLVFSLTACSSSAPNGQSVNESESTPETMSTEELKEVALANDLEIYTPARSASASNEKLLELMQQLESGESTLLDVYSYCTQIEEFYKTWRDQLSEIEDDSAEEYIDACSGHCANTYMIASHLKKYIDDTDMASLDSAKECIGLIAYSENEITEKRTAYLSQAGCTEEEISARFEIG